MKTIKRMTADQNKFDSVNFNITAPEGDVNIIINEASPGKIYNIIVLVGKSGSSLRAMTDALSRMITFALHQTELTDVLNELSSITSDKARIVTGGVVVRSVPEAIYLALLRYRNMYPTVKHINPDKENRPVYFANPNLADI